MAPSMFVVGTTTRSWREGPLYDCRSAADVSAVPDGAFACRWGYVAQRDEDCIDPTELETWRRLGDPLADGVVEALDLKPGCDGLARIREHIDSLEPDQRDRRVVDFWTAVTSLPPDGVTALAPGRKPEPADFCPDEAIQRATRQPEPTLAEGQAVFTRYSAQIFTSLLHFSLAAGLTSPRLLPTLHETNYLTGASRDVTFRRLLETSQFFFDAMSDMQPLTGRGWKSAVRVRLLHAQVRVRIARGKGRLNTYDIERDGVPINQEDLFATLGSFSIAPLWSLRRMGFSLTNREQLAFLAVWRHIGYYIGVDTKLLERYYGRTVSTADKSFASCAFHLFDSDVPPADPYQTTTYRVLSSVAGRPPSFTTIDHHIYLTRVLVGEGLADRLALPPVPWRVKARVHAELFAGRALYLFGSYYRRGFEIERQLLFKNIIEAIAAWQMGERRTRFVAKTEADHGRPLDEVGDGEPSIVKLGPEAGRQIRRRWYGLMRELVCVLVGASASLVGVSYLTFRLLS